MDQLVNDDTCKEQLIELGLKEQLIATLGNKNEDVKKEALETISELLKDPAQLESMGQVIEAENFIQNVKEPEQIKEIYAVFNAQENPSEEAAKKIYEKIQEME